MPARKSARATVLTPVSDTAAQLIHLLRQEAAEAAAPAPGTIVLQPLARLKAYRDHGACHFIAYSEDFQSSVRLTRYYQWDSEPAWYGHETRRDTEGRTWERTFYALVDDFGSLVEVRQ